MNFEHVISIIDDWVWGPVMLTLLMGTGVFLTLRLKFRPWINLGYAIKITLSKDARTTQGGAGDVSSFSALTTALASTIGTGNIVGVATAMVAGGPGALVWMWIAACFGLSSKFGECMLAVKYRERNDKGEMMGGPMYTMKNGFRNKRIGAMLGMLFAVFAVIASFGIGNMTQANSISTALHTTFGMPKPIVGSVVTILSLMIIVGGIQRISKITSVVVPAMAAFYMLAGVIAIGVNIRNIPSGLAVMFRMAFDLKAVSGGVCGSVTASMMQAMRYGISRGVFSNEAGMGSAAITAAAATTQNPVRQGYINMTGTFWDTMVVCTITGLCLATSGVLERADASMQGAALTIAAFSTSFAKIHQSFGAMGKSVVTIGIVLFAFSTILGWEYQGEKAFEYFCGKRKFCMLYRILFSLMVYVGATQSLTLVWGFSDIANALMCMPNLVCLLVMSGEIAEETERFERMKK